MIIGALPLLILYILSIVSILIIYRNKIDEYRTDKNFNNQTGN